MTELERHPERSRRLDDLGVGADQADTGGRYTFVFDEVGQYANGGRAARSDGYKQDSVDVIFLE